jgi:hypothetical protein
MRILIKNVRLAFPAIFKPEAIGDGEPAYSARFIIEPNSEVAQQIDDAIVAVAKEKWKDDWKTVLDGIIEDKLCCFEKRDYVNKKTRKVYDGFKGKWHIGARSPADKPRPTTFSADKEEVGPSVGLIYPGAFVDGSLEIWAQDNQFGRRINAQLRGVRFRAHGESFGGGSGPADADDFDDEEAASNAASDFV